MLRARAGRPGRPGFLAACLAVAVLAAACVGGPSNAPATAPDSTATDVATLDPTVEPTVTDPPTDAPTDAPTATPAVTPGETEAPAAACSGSDQNREFFDQAAAAITWPVYCLVLPDGWFLEGGSYRLANGGGVDVTYRSSVGLQLALFEGNVCEGADVEACAPRDALIGPAAFADREGELGQLGSSLVLDVDRGATPTWRLVGNGLDEAAFRAIGEAALLVEG